MTVGTVTPYTKNLSFLNIAALVAGTVKCALVTSSYTPDHTSSGNSVWADASSNEITAAHGYSAGGFPLTTPASTAVTGGYKYSSDSAAWTASGGSIDAWRHAVFYYSGTLGGLTNPLICSFLGDTTPADVPATSSTNTLTLGCPSDGWFKTTA